MTSGLPNVAISTDFFDAFARLPKPIQRKVRDFTEKFRLNPKSPGINYEKLHQVRDEKIRSVRIDKSYRAIIVHPPQGNVYVLAWVDHHDEAIAWAYRRVYDINPVTGALQVIATPIEPDFAITQESAPPPLPETRLFDAFSNETLLSLGTPQLFLEEVRALATRQELDSLGNALPDEVRESLAFLAEGLPLDEVLDLYASLRGKTITVDTEDYERALQQPDSKRRFIMNPSMQDLDAMLKEPLAKWRLFLHPQQRTLVEKQFNGSARVLGSAGTGKTVVAMHRAKYLASTIFPNDSDRILLTTFTSYLSANISQLMKSLCPDELSRIDIMHLHSWAARFLLKHGIQFKVISDEEAQEFWSAACNKAGVQDWGIGFVRQEWNLVVQAKGIERKEDYLRFPRIGRGTTLSRSERAEIWQVFDEYQKMLHQYHKREWIDVIRETRHLLESRASTLPYRAIIVDEAQDFHEEEWRLIRAMVPRGPNDIFVVGDAHQRIFGGQIVLGRCGIDIRGRASKLRINYRTTEQIRNWAIAMLDGSPYDDLDGGVDNLTGYTSLRNGVQPTVLHFNTLAEEQTSLLSILHAQLRQRPAEEICLVSASRSILQRDYLPLLENAHIPFLFLGKTDSGNPSGIRVTNMHRVKGLEFASVIAVGVNESMNPNTPHEVADNPSDRKEYEARQRSLLYVSATRARDELIISCHGKPSPYIEQSIVVSCNER